MPGTAVQKARKLIERDKVNFLLGNVNSALALAMAQVSNEKGVLHVVPGGHTDAVTGATCHWNVFRVCNTTQMEANAVAGTLIKTAGKKWYYITPDYAFGHTLQAGLEKACTRLGGSKVGADLTPLGHDGLFVLPHQGAIGESRHHHLPGSGRRHDQRPQAGGAIRTRQEGAPRRVRSRSSSRSRACRPKRASARGSSSGTGTSPTCLTSRSSSPTSRS